MSRDAATTDLRHWALRLAFAVTFGLVFEAMRGAPLPPLAPVIALQLLAVSRVPPGGRMVVMLLVVATATSGLAYLVSIMTVGFTGLYTIGVGVLYLWGFALALKKGTAMIGVLSLTMTVVITGFASSSTGLALGVLVSLVISVAEAFVLVYLAYAVFPGAPASDQPPAQQAAVTGSSLSLAQRALLATIVVLPAHLYLNADGIASMVILLTMVTMLRQPGIAQSTRYCLAFVAGNGFGASLAAVAVLFITLQDHIPVLISVTAAGALFLSWLLTRGGRWVPVLLPGYVAYTLLFGLVLSPLPLTKGVAVVDRVLLIVAGGAYAMAFVSLLIPALPYLARLGGARAA